MLKTFDTTTKKLISEDREILSKKERRKRKFEKRYKDQKHLEMLKEKNSFSRIGLCYFFENIVVFGNPIQLGSRIQNQLGEFLGAVYCKMPNDPFYLLYKRIQNTKSYIKRKGNQKSLDFKKVPLKGINLCRFCQEKLLH